MVLRFVTLLASLAGFVSIRSRRCNAFSLQTQRDAALVPRVTLDEYLSSPITNTPILIRDVASPETIESLADELMSILGQEEVQMQRKIKDEDDGSQTTEIYDLALEDTIEYIMMDSNHYDSYFAFCEGLLPSSTIPGSSKLSERFRAVREAPFADQENWFDYFPSNIQPTDAIILAGAGATSTLHRDPFEWTGTSLCLEGTKIWRFILPPPESNGGVGVVDNALNSYRLDSIAWEEDMTETDEPVVVSAGWQSDMTLYDTIDDDFPSAIEWVTMEEEDPDQFQREIEDVGMDLSYLRPSTLASDALNEVNKARHKSNDGPSPSVVTAIQQPGDLLIIPAHCWHQTYAPLPSVAVASQRCGASTDGANVIGHMLEMLKCDETKLPDVLKRNCYDEGVGEEVIATFLKHVNMATQ